jgi:hypothetical protein
LVMVQQETTKFWINWQSKGLNKLEIMA